MLHGGFGIGFLGLLKYSGFFHVISIYCCIAVLRIHHYDDRFVSLLRAVVDTFMVVKCIFADQRLKTLK